MHEIHALAAEAAILELREVAAVARGAEVSLRAWVESESDADAQRASRAIDEIEAIVAGVTTRA
jgi:hypothetical protein